VTRSVADSLSFYLHIPYCVKRCGYCDFNTYTPGELKVGSGVAEVSQGYIDLMIKEVEQARSESGATLVPTIFFGGGTPTLMDPSDLGRLITRIGELFTITPECEITIEANPDTVSLDSLIALRATGINRISFGMQSAVPHVLAALDRTHNPENVTKATHWAREAGFDEVSVDLIYGAPGESLADWQRTLDIALSLPITHISAYALIVEEGTKLGAQVKRGEVTMPDDDETAEKYLLADRAFEAAGFTWYELSNWAKPGSYSRHNMAYWINADWWGVGPGAHSHIAGKRFWNVKHPNAYRDRITAGLSPALDQEILTESEKESEKILLGIRLRQGLPLSGLSQDQQLRAAIFLEAGSLERAAWTTGSLVLTEQGRLVADLIVREIVM
jgi:oxygen-independent coproporphyrinogen-3 oxidase